MDAKYLAEIRARDSAELPETAAPVFRDRHALLAEVKRLTAENAKLKESALDPVELAKVAIVLQENATLEKALELMSRTACGETPGNMPEWDMVGCVPDESCMKENPCKGTDNQCHECWTRYFIQQAQQTHETQEAEK